MSQHVLRDVYVTATGAFLPGDPVGNDDMEARLGLVGGVPSRYRKKILANNGITSRHYAIGPDGEQTHLNQDLAALAVEAALAQRGVATNEFDMLALGTTIPDVLMPGFASMVHGRLGGAPVETLSTAGICASGAAAILHAWTAVMAGRRERAVAGASELASVMMKGSRFKQESVVAPSRDDVAAGYKYFNADFLRWMLSDGAGAVVLEPAPVPGRPSLRVDWVELTSYAHDYTTCMFLGTSDPTAPAVGNTWLGMDNASDADAAGMLVVRQDTKLLAEGILASAIDELRRLVKAGRIDPDHSCDWFLPHLSSHFFADFLARALSEAGVDIPQDRWFTNLSTVGNIGSASLFVMLDEAVRTGRFQPGDRILAMVPESGRFSWSFMQFTAMAPES